MCVLHQPSAIFWFRRYGGSWRTKGVQVLCEIGKTESETFEMLKQAFGDSYMSRSRTFEWFGLFKNGRTSTANDDRSGQPSTATTPSKVEKGTDGCRPGSSSYHTWSLCRGWNWLWILSVNSDRTTEHALDCSEVCAESVDAGSGRQSSSDLSGTEGNRDKRSHTPLERHHRRWKHRLCLLPRDKTAIFAMEESWVSKTQKSTYSKKQIEDDPDLFLWPSGDRTPGICPTWNDGQCRLLWCSKKCYVKMCGARGYRNGKTRTSLSTTTMPRLTGPLKFRSFWPRTTWQWSPVPHTHPIWPPVTFSSSQAEASDEGLKIRHHWRDSRGIAADTWHNFKNGLLGMLPSMQKCWNRCIRAKREYFEGDEQI